MLSKRTLSAALKYMHRVRQHREHPESRFLRKVSQCGTPDFTLTACSSKESGDGMSDGSYTLTKSPVSHWPIRLRRITVLTHMQGGSSATAYRSKFRLCNCRLSEGYQHSIGATRATSDSVLGQGPRSSSKPTVDLESSFALLNTARCAAHSLLVIISFQPSSS